jgi:hypothetical protein
VLVVAYNKQVTSLNTIFKLFLFIDMENYPKLVCVRLYKTHGVAQDHVLELSGPLTQYSKEFMNKAYNLLPYASYNIYCSSIHSFTSPENVLPSPVPDMQLLQGEDTDNDKAYKPFKEEAVVFFAFHVDAQDLSLPINNAIPKFRGEVVVFAAAIGQDLTSYMEAYLDYRILLPGDGLDTMLRVWSRYKALLDSEVGLMWEEDTSNLQDDLIENQRIYDLCKPLLMQLNATPFSVEAFKHVLLLVSPC